MNKSASNFSKGLTFRANFSWTFIGNTIHAASWFGMTIVLAKLGSPMMVGQFALGLAATAPIFMFATLRLRDVQATDAKQEYSFSDYFALRLITTCLALSVVVGFVLVSGYRGEMAMIIVATAVSKSVGAIGDAFYGLFMHRERLDRMAKSMMIKGPLELIGLSTGVYLTGSVFWGMIGWVIARTVVLLGYDLRMAVLCLNPDSKPIAFFIPRELPRPRWHAKTLARLTWLTLPLGFVTMLISFNINIPRYFIEWNLGAYQLGIFAAIAAFQKTAPTVVQALGRSASPRLSRYYAANNTRAYRRLALKLAGLGALLGGAGVLVALVAGRPILTLFYGPEYALPGIFGLIMLAAGIDYIATMLLFAVTSARYFKVQLPLHLVTTSTIAVACFFLIPAFGLQGAAMALITGNLVRAGGSLIAVWHALHALKKDRMMVAEEHMSLETSSVSNI